MEEVKSLKDRGILITLNISQWKGVVTDNAVTAEVHTNHQAKDAGVYLKSLIDKKAFSGINTVLNEIRKVHYKRTLPWNDNAYRLIGSEHLMDYLAEVDGLKVKFFKEVDTFIDNYDQWKLDAKDRLGTMYDPNEYPSKDEVRSKFDVSTTPAHITEEDDIRVKASEEQLQSLRNSVKKDLESKLARATEDILDRVKKTIGHLISRLSDPDNSFKDATIKNIEELVNLIPALNFDNDKRIMAICEDMKKLIVDPDNIRKDETVREEVVNKAESILSKYGL